MVDHTRHSGIFDASNLSVTLVGAGGIGAMTALMLVKMGIANLLVFDADTVSPENLATQLHRLGTEDEPKVEALEKTLKLFGDDTNIYSCNERVTPNDILYGSIIISAVDSIQARKDIWAAVLNQPDSRFPSKEVGWYIDARMSSEEFQMHVVDMNKPEAVGRYAALIAGEDDSRVEEIPCTAKATFYCAAHAAGHIGAAVRKIATGLRPAAYLVHNMVSDKLFHLGDA